MACLPDWRAFSPLSFQAKATRRRHEVNGSRHAPIASPVFAHVRFIAPYYPAAPTPIVRHWPAAAAHWGQARVGVAAGSVAAVVAAGERQSRTGYGLRAEALEVAG